MAVRIKEGMIPYTGGVGIEITNNHVINLLLREANNLIHVNENNEVYVDLQLDDGILPDDDFPVGVTTGKILQEDGWQQSGLILNWKTTSGDYARLIYANDGSLYVDLGDGVRIEILGPGGTRVNRGQIGGYLRNQTDLAEALDEKVNLGENQITDGTIVSLSECVETPGGLVGTGKWIELNPNGTVMVHQANVAGYKEATLNNGALTLLSNTAVGGDKTVTIDHEKIVADDGVNNQTYYFLGQHRIATLDDIQAGTRITIDQNPTTGVLTINADISGAMTYKGNVTDPSALPSSGNTQGDCRYSESNGHLYAWDGTQWKDIGGTGINLNDYFNKTTDDSDDITEGSIHLFCTAIEKSYWNSKQDALTAGGGIDITNNVISARYTGGSNISIDNNYAINNDAPFEPDNAGSMGQILQKTSNGYEWRNPNFVTSVNGQSGAVTVDEFDPDNAGTTGQVLKKTANGYEWSNETAGSYTGGTGININQSTKVISNALPFNPTNSGTSGQVLKLNQDGTTYSWQNESGGGGGGGTTYYGGDYITIDSSNYINNTAPFTPTAGGTTGQVLTKTSNGYTWDDISTPSGENNVKFWTIDMRNGSTITSARLGEIYQRVNADPNNGAVINELANNDVFVFSYMKTVEGLDYPVAKFLGSKRKSRATLVTGSGYITTQDGYVLNITRSSTGYAVIVIQDDDDATHTNYISALPIGYQESDPFMPTKNYQPATKAYVDTAISQSGGGNVTGPSSSTDGHLALFDGATGKVIKDGGAVPVPTVISGVSGTTYTIQVANSDPASGTPATTITFVL